MNDFKKEKTAIIIGAGPAGLTAGYELVKRGYQVIILEEDEEYVGGISRTVSYKGNRFDIGGHRFFSKNERIVEYWKEIVGNEFLKRLRLSRWYYKKKFFKYPINPFEILFKFGPFFAFHILTSYIYRKFFPIKPEKNLADWFKNNFGDFLAKPFFIEYNLKLWGIPCEELSLDFAKQRIKGVSFREVVKGFFKKKFDYNKNEVKSFINEFYYPKYGPGQLWERMAELIEKADGKILKGHKVIKVNLGDENKVKSVTAIHKGQEGEFKADVFLSTMPFKDLALSISPSLPEDILNSARKLKYRDFITIALVINKKDVCPDNWIYTHNKGMKLIRFQNFKNWSPFMVKDENKTIVGLEYTCNCNDSFCGMDDDSLMEQGKKDFVQLGFASMSDISDSSIVRLRNVYPVYKLGYKEHIDVIKECVDNIKNLYPMGRGGIHRYNNMDHSMTTAFLTVKNIVGGEKKFDVFKINGNNKYIEE